MIDKKVVELFTPVSEWTPIEGKVIVLRNNEELRHLNYSKLYGYHTISTMNGEFHSTNPVKGVTHVLELSKLQKIEETGVKTRKKTWLQKIKSLFVNNATQESQELPEVGKDYEDKSWSDTKVRVLAISKNKLEVRYQFIMVSGTKVFEGSKNTVTIRAFLKHYEKSNV